MLAAKLYVSEVERFSKFVSDIAESDFGNGDVDFMESFQKDVLSEGLVTAIRKEKNWLLPKLVVAGAVPSSPHLGAAMMVDNVAAFSYLLSLGVQVQSPQTWLEKACMQSSSKVLGLMLSRQDVFPMKSIGRVASRAFLKTPFPVGHVECVKMLVPLLSKKQLTRTLVLALESSSPTSAEILLPTLLELPGKRDFVMVMKSCIKMGNGVAAKTVMSAAGFSENELSEFAKFGLFHFNKDVFELLWNSLPKTVKNEIRADYFAKKEDTHLFPFEESFLHALFLEQGFGAECDCRKTRVSP